MRARWAKWVMASSGFLLISGIVALTTALLGALAREIGGRLQTLAFTATADAPTRGDIVAGDGVAVLQPGDDLPGESRIAVVDIGSPVLERAHIAVVDAGNAGPAADDEAALSAIRDAGIECDAILTERVFSLNGLGAYAVQGIGAFAVARIEGSYSNVVGLPQCEVVEALVAERLLPTFPLSP